MRHACSILVFAGLVLATGCASKPATSPANALPSPLMPVVVLPSTAQMTAAQKTSIPAVSNAGWVAARNDGKLGSEPTAIPMFLAGDRTMRDTQWISSGRPYANFRYSVRIRSMFRP